MKSAADTEPLYTNVAAMKPARLVIAGYEIETNMSCGIERD